MSTVRSRLLTVIAAAAAAAGLLLAVPAAARRPPLSAHQRSVLGGIARDTWRFYAADVDPGTHLPLDNLGPGATRGAYTSAANIGVYLWAVVAARDLGLISTSRAQRLARIDARRGRPAQALRRVSVPVVRHRQRPGAREPRAA